MALRDHKILVGCGLGCVAIVLLVTFTVIGFFVWLGRPGELLDPRRLLGDDTTGYVEWTLRLEDPGTRSLVDGLLKFSQDQNRRATEMLPPLIGSWLGQLQQRRNEKKLAELFPLVAAWSAYPSTDTARDLQLFTLSVEKIGNRVVFVDWLLGHLLKRSPEFDVVSHQSERLYRIRREEVTFFFRRSDVFITSDLETAKQTVERLNRPKRGDSPASGVTAMFRELPRDRPLRGAISNLRGETRRLWQFLPLGAEAHALPDSSWDGVRAATVWGGFVEGASFQAQLHLFCRDAEWAQDHADEMAGALRAAAERSEIPLEIDGTADGDRIRIDFHAEDLPGALEEMLERIEATRQRRDPEHDPH